MSSEALKETRAGGELTLLEWYALPDDQTGELFDGRLVEEEVPSFIHELLVALLARILGDWVLPRGGVVAGSGVKFAVGPDRGRKPDLSLYLPGSEMPPRHGLVETPPDVAIEIVSPSPRDGRRDRVEKVDDYAAFGVRYSWIVDPELRSLEILELGADGRYVRALGATEGTLDIPGCDDLELDLDELWAAGDRLSSD